jgi:hypothetical protein
LRVVVPANLWELYPVMGGLYPVYPVKYPVKISAKLYPVGYAKVPSHSLVTHGLWAVPNLAMFDR